MTGNIVIPQGQNSVQVTGLGLSQAVTPSLTLLAPADPPDSLFAYLAGPATTDGFVIQLSAPPSVDGYSVQWDLEDGSVLPPASNTGGAYRSCTFKSVFQGVAMMLGLDVSRDLAPSRFGMLTEYINNRLKEAWEFDWWPELTTREQRAYRRTWNYITNYTAGTHVLFYAPNSPGYYQSLQGAVNQPPTDNLGNINLAYWAAAANGWSTSPWYTNTQYNLGDQVLDSTTGFYFQCINPHVSGATINYAYFARLVPFDRYIAYNQDFPAITGKTYSNGGATALGRVKTVSANDPFIATRNPGYIPFRLSDLGVQVNISAPAVVWVQFAYQEPVFTNVAWSSTFAYTGAGELVYRASTGQCYTSIAASTGLDPATNPQAWAVVLFPLVLSNFVKRAALADALRDLKQDDRAQIEEGRAYEELANAQDRAIQSQSGSEMAQVETYGGRGSNFFSS